MGDSTTMEEMEQESQNEKKRDRVTFQKCATLPAPTCMGDSTHISNHSPSKERNLSDDLKCQNSINSENISLTIYLSITLDFMDDNHCVCVCNNTNTRLTEMPNPCPSVCLSWRENAPKLYTHCSVGVNWVYHTKCMSLWIHSEFSCALLLRVRGIKAKGWSELFRYFDLFVPFSSFCALLYYTPAVR